MKEKLRRARVSQTFSVFQEVAAADRDACEDGHSVRILRPQLLVLAKQKPLAALSYSRMKMT